MINVNGIDHQVVCWTPAGRERTMSILRRYMTREHTRGIVDRWDLLINTGPGQQSDLRYLARIAGEHSWIRAVRIVGLPRLSPKQRNTGYYQRLCGLEADAGVAPTVYVRLDDDIIYLHPEAVERLVRARVASQGAATCAFPMIINNAVCSHLLQRHGRFADFRDVDGEPFGRIEMHCTDRIGWGSGAFAVQLHRWFLDLAEAGPDCVEAGPAGDGTGGACLHQEFPLPAGLQFSVSVMAVTGEDYLTLPGPGVLPHEEEETAHTIVWPQRWAPARPNTCVSDAVFGHYTFSSQHAEIDGSGILERYRDLAARDCSPEFVARIGDGAARRAEMMTMAEDDAFGGVA